MERPEVVVIPTGVANLASITAALRRIGANARLAEDAQHIRRAKAVVLPGVGAFGAAMSELGRCNLTSVIAERILAAKPTLAVCLGMQLLCASSEETPGIAGLGIIPSMVRRLRPTVPVPQIGWNFVQASNATRLLRSGHAYFANSYCLDEPPADWAWAIGEHGGSFVAGIERGPVLACQFHPELSGQWGLDLLTRWLARAAQEDATC